MQDSARRPHRLPAAYHDHIELIASRILVGLVVSHPV